uniref:Uncharacterized protein n=1 Tax=Picea glauca TaxID=3330 RepID=A0A101LZW6_PICGL|nr:hypothetical protein ABT39_MTgene4461 [Picea glauca]QHR91335.1 hypothetical protein Q903MT_gene5367 [Picea sitchensis]
MAPLLAFPLPLLIAWVLLPLMLVVLALLLPLMRLCLLFTVAIYPTHNHLLYMMNFND